MLHICVIADCVDDQYAGVYTYATELINALERCKSSMVDITYLHFRKNDFFKGKKELIVPLAKRFPGSSTWRKFFVLPHILKQRKFQVVHELSHISPFLWKDAPYTKIMTIHDLTPILFPGFHVPQGHLLQRILLPHYMRVVDKIITVSISTAQDIERVYGRKKEVHPILLASRFAALSLNATRKNNEIRLIGKKGWKCEDVFMLIDQSIWKDDIIWEGYVTEERMKEAYESAQVFVYPSFYEGFGLPVLEAMQYGLPVIAGNNSSIPEVLGNAGILCDVSKEDEIVHALQTLLLNPQAESLRRDLGTRAYERAQDFSWDRVAKETLQVYEGA